MLESGLTRLSIVNAEYYAYHGVRTEEKNLGGKYEIDLDLFYDATNAVLKDDVKDSVNYEEALFCVSEVINGAESYNLVETICSEILNMIMDKFDNLEMATVRVRKHAVPIKRVIAYVEAEQSMSRIDE
ncbi:MAG: dihydroneopterin aldolase [Candidatus Kapabacteria bacterium]|jgi:dihydroneopterin aldolase|nr:dihydroneopterin aldolase [Candidatus Kapabacteria bacterium]